MSLKKEKPYQISFTDTNNNINAHIYDSKLQEKFFKFLQSESDYEYLVEIWDATSSIKPYNFL